MKNVESILSRKRTFLSLTPHILHVFCVDVNVSIEYLSSSIKRFCCESWD